MNCFQFCIFAVLFTTLVKALEIVKKLWIAFNFVSLQCYLQRFKFAVVPSIGCELLSILYLCSVIYNIYSLTTSKVRVVNCFQFCIFAVLFTTLCVYLKTITGLWIAFNFVSLQCYLQHDYEWANYECGCELLSILYLCSVIYNRDVF